MTRILLPALLLSAQLAAADTDFTIDGRTYRLVTTARTWDAAEADAAREARGRRRRERWPVERAVLDAGAA